jgi:SNF2 family DNA or RNA helicase
VNPKAQTTQNLYKIRCDKRIALTGTPISNSPMDIFGIMNWLVPGYLGTLSQFKKKYCEEADSGWGYSKITGFRNLEILREKVGRFMLRRTKEEVFKDFPPKVVENIVFSLSDTERVMYNLIKEEVINEIRKLGDLDTRTLNIIPVKMLRLKQCTGHTELVGADRGESSKLDALKALLEPIIASGEKAIVFTQFSSMLHIIKRELEKYNPFVIYGDVDSEDRMKRVQEFNNKEGGAVIIMTEAGAYGLNMQSASYVFHYDAPWSIAKLQQREDRAHRIGQNKSVTIYNLIAKNTIDEYVMKVLHKKQVVSVDILNDAERLEDQGLSREDINEILRL